ncbi:MAG: glycine zipper 2TM domain-containing protein [Betaproteobacteria bacterium]|nr:glycine zipper 2TM domain-containing protein [Betaproteobacteria bacterium]
MKITRCHLSAAITIAFFVAAIAVAPQAQAKCDNCGTVTDVKTIKKEGEGSGVGAVAGGVLGGVLGHQIGSGRGNTAATIVGAGAGAYAGNQVEKSQKSTTTYQVAVKMEDGKSRTFNFSKQTSYRIGDKVRIVDGKLTHE